MRRALRRGLGRTRSKAHRRSHPPAMEENVGWEKRGDHACSNKNLRKTKKNK